MFVKSVIAPMALWMLLIVWYIAPPAVAYRKGYSIWPWICAMGAFGVLALAFFPIQSKIESQEKRLKYRMLANFIGAPLSLLGLTLLITWAERFMLLSPIFEHFSRNCEPKL